MHTKKNETGYADALFREAEGLELLEKAIATAEVRGLSVPQVYSVSEERLEMTAITALRGTDQVLQTFGEGLARLHALPQSHYGFHHDNYIGLNPQKNRECERWGAFFVECRLGFQVSLLKEEALRDRFSEVLAAKGELLAQWLDERTSGPSLLHGDLWSGNALFDDDTAWLIDPAVYYGDSEADIAMTEMFGGFGPAFYESYRKNRPLSADYATKREVYNLYHFLNHYNLFGGFYRAPCERGLEIISRL